MPGPLLALRALGGSNAISTDIVSDATYQLARPDLVTGVPAVSMVTPIQNCTVRTYLDGVFNTSLTVSATLTPILSASGAPLTASQISGLTLEISGLQYAEVLRVTDEPNGTYRNPFLTTSARNAAYSSAPALLTPAYVADPTPGNPPIRYEYIGPGVDDAAWVAMPTPQVGGWIKSLSPLLAPSRAFAIKADMDAAAAAGAFTEGNRVLLLDPLYDARGNGVVWEYDSLRSRMVRVLNNRNYAKLGSGVGSGINFVPTTNYTVVPFPTVSPNGGTKKIARGDYRSVNAEGSHITPGWRVCSRIDWAGVKSNADRLFFLLKLGGVAMCELFIDLSSLTIDGTNGNSIIAWPEWIIHPNNAGSSSSYNFDVHAKMRYGACSYLGNQTQVQDLQVTNWHYVAVPDGSDASPVHPEIEVACKYSGNPRTVYFDSLLVSET